MQPHNNPGHLIAIEGADGSGTSTMSKKLAKEIDAHLTDEPTGNKVGRKVDEIISEEGYSPDTIALGFAFDRKLHLEEDVVPHMKEGGTVVTDRYYHSSLVYQPLLGETRGEVERLKERVQMLNQETIKPDLTIILDITPKEGERRTKSREGGKDENIFENLSFQQKVIKSYRGLPERLDENIEVVDANKSKEEVFERIMEAVENSKVDF